MVRAFPISLETFESAVGAALRRETVLNQVQLGIIEQMRADPTRYPDGVRLLAARDESTGAIGLASQTPPYKAVVSHASAELAFELGRAFASRFPEANMVHGPGEAARAFARGAGAPNPTVVTDEAVFELRMLNPPPPVGGSPRVAVPDDADVLQAWCDAFTDEAQPDGTPKDPKAGVRMANSGRTWIWLRDDGLPVSMANNPHRVGGWWAIGPVYTPPEYRGHGYASGIVAHASGLALASGAPGCTLFTDLSNPISNRIYERLGYRRAGTFVTLRW